MKIGSQQITVLMVNVSGAPITGEAASIEPLVMVEGIEIPTTVDEVSGSGLYAVEFTVSAAGQGYFQVTSSNPAYVLSPTHGDLDYQATDSDTVFSRLSGSSLISPRTSFSSFSYASVEGDDIEMQVQVSTLYADINDWTGLACEFRSNSNFSATPDISGCSVVVTSPSERLVTVSIPSAQTDGMITAQQVQSVIYYGDIKGINTASDVTTVGTVALTLRREYTF